MKGLFITFEGSEGCGKSTQSRLLYQYLKKKGFDAVYLREPGGTEISERLRKILLDSKNHSMTPICEMLLYMASRAQVVNEFIKPALKKGRIVVCDRFLDSTLAYQGFGLGIDIDFIKRVGDFVTCRIRPDLTILLDLSVKEALKRCGHIKDRIEKRSLEYHRRVREGYLRLAKSEPQRIKIVKVNKDIMAIQGNIRELVDRYLKVK
jgi:dTMP kinase